eukprot:172978_1
MEDITAVSILTAEVEMALQPAETENASEGDIIAAVSNTMENTTLDGADNPEVVAAADTAIQVAAVDAGTTLTEATEIVDGTTAAARATMATIDVGTTVTAAETVVAAADNAIQVAAVDAGTTLTEATEIVDGTTAAETVVEASDAGSPLTDASKIGDGATAAARATMATIDVGTTVTAVEKETIIATGQSDQTEGKKRKADAALTADLKSEVTKKRKFEEGENLAN